MSTIERLENEAKLAGQLVDAGMAYVKYDSSLTAFIILLEYAIRELKLLEETNRILGEQLRGKK